MRTISHLVLFLSLMARTFAAPAAGADLEVRQLPGPLGGLFPGLSPGLPSQVQAPQPTVQQFNAAPGKPQYRPTNSPVNNNVGPSQNTNISPNTFAPNTNSETISDIQSQCNSDQVVSCCNDSSQSSAGGLLGLIVGPILGGQCSGVTADLLKLVDILNPSSVCGNDASVRCCSGNQNTGLLNVDLGLQCTDILSQ